MREGGREGGMGEGGKESQGGRESQCFFTHKQKTTLPRGRVSRLAFIFSRTVCGQSLKNNYCVFKTEMVTKHQGWALHIPSTQEALLIPKSY